MAGAAGGGGNWRHATSFLRRLSITGKAGQLKCQGQAVVGVGMGSRPAHTPGVLSGVTGPIPSSPTTCHHPGISQGRNGCQPYRAGSHQSRACAGLPRLASRWLGSRPEAPPRSPRQTLGNPEGPLSSSQGSRGSRAAGWRATLPGPRLPRWQASPGHLPLWPWPHPFYGASPGSNEPRDTRNQS